MSNIAILYDASKCTACRGCQVACKQWNDLKGDVTKNRGTYENPPDLSANTWLKMKFIETGEYPDIRWLFGRRSCMHCTESACVDVCPTKALYHHEMGFVAYDKSKCSGCGYCVEACPFDIPRSSSGAITGIRHANKCTLCQDRVTNDEKPACVKTCPTGALTFGERADMLAAAQARLSVLKADNTKANIYGDSQLGGLHVIYVLEDSPDVYGLPIDPKVPIATTVWKDIVQPVGWGLAGVVVLGLGLNYVIAQRKIKIKSEGE